LKSNQQFVIGSIDQVRPGADRRGPQNSQDFALMIESATHPQASRMPIVAERFYFVAVNGCRYDGIVSPHCCTGGFLNPAFCTVTPISALTPLILGGGDTKIVSAKHRAAFDL
jgi:hypothetical protein